MARERPRETAGLAASDDQGLRQLARAIQGAEGPVQVLAACARRLLAVLEAESASVYHLARDGRTLTCWFSIGGAVRDESLPVDFRSLPGFAARTHKPAVVANLYDAAELGRLHADLRIDYAREADRGGVTLAAMAFPIMDGGILLGVLEATNCTDSTGGHEFGDRHVAKGEALATALAAKLRASPAQAADDEGGPFDYLVTDGTISPAQFDQIQKLAATGKVSLGRLLVNVAGLSMEAVGDRLAHYHQVPFMAYDPDYELDSALLDKLNRDYLRRRRWLPLSVTAEKAVVLIDDPTDYERIIEIEGILKASVYDFRVALSDDIPRFLGSDVLEVETEDGRADLGLTELVAEMRESEGGSDRHEGEDGAFIDENAPAVVRLVSKLIADAVEADASDIHIEPGETHAPATVRMRVDGICRKVLDIPSTRVRAVIARIKVLSNLDITEDRVPQDGKMKVKIGDRTRELRVAVLPTVQGESAVLRVLAGGKGLRVVDELDLSTRNRDQLLDLVARPYGLFLVVGPTGSGKTTTLHAIIAQINMPSTKVWTVEDPVEITQPGLQQMQVNAKVKLDFAHALRAFLRADPDVILVGEMRDYETAHTGIQASLTGHLVLSTLHTNSAAETITRLLDMGLDPINFSDALIGVLGQRLVRRLCSRCRVAYKPADEEIDELMQAYGPEAGDELSLGTRDVRLWRANGCEECGGSGYRGRIGIHELLAASKPLKRLVRLGKPAEAILELAVSEGMRTLRQDGITKVQRGDTDWSHVRAVTAT